MNSHAARQSGKSFNKSDALPELLSRKSSGREVLQRMCFADGGKVSALRRRQQARSEVL
jgi:hypothetical protein